MIESNLIYQFFNNSTVAAVVAVILGAIIASLQYGKQKGIDRSIDIKKDVLSDLTKLQELTHHSLLIIDRIANTYSSLEQSYGDWSDMHQVLRERLGENWLKDSLEGEISTLSGIINEEIPSLVTRITSKLNVYYKHHKKILDEYHDLKSRLKKWHDPIVKLQISFRERVGGQPTLSLDALDEQIRKLINMIWGADIDNGRSRKGN